MKKKVNTGFFSKYSISELSEKSDYWLNKQGRLTNPMFKAENSDYYEEISWNDAFEMIGKQLNELECQMKRYFILQVNQ